MSHQNRLEKTEKNLGRLESEFKEYLLQALRSCAAGRWGMFGQNDQVTRERFGKYAHRYLSQEAQRLIDLGNQIEILRSQLGLDKCSLYERYQYFCNKRDANDPGEPKLALQFLDELSDKSRGTTEYDKENV